MCKYFFLRAFPCVSAFLRALGAQQAVDGDAAPAELVDVVDGAEPAPHDPEPGLDGSEGVVDERKAAEAAALAEASKVEDDVAEMRDVGELRAKLRAAARRKSIFTPRKSVVALSEESFVGNEYQYNVENGKVMILLLVTSTSTMSKMGR